MNLDRGSYDLSDVDAGGLLIWGLGPNSGSLQEQNEILASQPCLWPQVFWNVSYNKWDGSFLLQLMIVFPCFVSDIFLTS